MLLIRPSDANFCLPCSSDHISERSASTLRILSVLAAPLSRSRAVVVRYRIRHRTDSMLRNSSLQQSTDKLLLSILSTLSTRTSIVSPWSHHACIHRCKAATWFLHSPVSTVSIPHFRVQIAAVIQLCCTRNIRR